MVVYNVSIPENKQEFFQEFLELIGAEYEKKQDNGFELSEHQKKLLEQRLKENKKNFIPARQALKQLREKYEL